MQFITNQDENEETPRLSHFAPIPYLLSSFQLILSLPVKAVKTIELLYTIYFI